MRSKCSRSPFVHWNFSLIFNCYVVKEGLKSTYKKYLYTILSIHLTFPFLPLKKDRAAIWFFPEKKKDRIIAWSHSRRSQLFEVGVFKRSLLKFRHRHFFNYNCIAIASILGSFVWLEGHSGLKNLKKFNLDKSKRATKKRFY